MTNTTHPARRLRHGDRPTEPLVFDDAAANKAAEEGELHKLHDELNRITWEGEDVGWNLAIAAVQKRILEIIAADRAARPVADKAEVEPVAEWVNYEQGFQYLVKAPLPDGTKLYATPPATTGASTAQRPTDDELWDATLRDRDAYQEWADKLADAIAKHFGVDIGEHSNQNLPWAEALEAIENAETVGASTVLTDAQIMQAWASVDTGGNGPELVAFGRAVERLAVAAQAGQVAAECLSEEQMDRIARNYFSEQWAIQHAKDAIHDALTEAGTACQAAVPEGFVLVPVKPTPKMVDATFNHVHLGSESHNARNKRIYAAMIAVAPSPAKESK